MTLVPALTLQSLRPRMGTKHPAATLTRSDRHQAMLTVIIILTLISLLVATEAEPASSPVAPLGEKPLRPAKKAVRGDDPKHDRIAA